MKMKKTQTKILNENKNVYDCAFCGSSILKGLPQCPFCGSDIKWKTHEQVTAEQKKDEDEYSWNKLQRGEITKTQYSNYHDKYGNIFKCKDCGRQITKAANARCTQCAFKFRKGTIYKSKKYDNIDFLARRKKGKCLDCGIAIYPEAKRCRKCALKHGWKRKSGNKNFVSKYNICLDCGKEITKESIRCGSCAQKYRHKSKSEPKQKVIEYKKLIPITEDESTTKKLLGTIKIERSSDSYKIELEEIKILNRLLLDEVIRLRKNNMEN